MVFFCAEEIHAHAPKPELHPEFNDEAQIVVTQRFHDGEVILHVPASAVFFWIGHIAEAFGGKDATPFEYFFAVLADVGRSFVSKSGPRDHFLYFLYDPGFAAVEYFLKLRDIEPLDRIELRRERVLWRTERLQHFFSQKAELVLKLYERIARLGETAVISRQGKRKRKQGAQFGLFG